MSTVRRSVNDLATVSPDLASEWDYSKNAPITPSDVTFGSGLKVWWIGKCGHSWQAKISNRNHGQKCPFCSNRRLLEGFNDLVTVAPSVAKDWNYEKNSGLLPNMVICGSHTKVWWRCANTHEWTATVRDRVNGGGCPVCSGKKVQPGFNDLSTTNPTLADQWNWEKNSISPNSVTSGSHKNVWWKCSEGHEWMAEIKSRQNGNGCPFCAGQRVIPGENDLLTMAPEIAEEWNYEKNKDLLPSMICEKSNRTVWWKCSEGHEWQAKVCNRRNGRKCPYCSNRKVLRGYNDFATVYPTLAEEWDYSKNILFPTDLIAGAHKKVWWKCKYGHSWNAYVDSRVQEHGCPYCVAKGTSLPEQGIAYYLSKITTVEQRAKVNRKEIDVFLPEYNIGIEYDGVYYHKNIDKDRLKEKAISLAGITLIRVKEADTNKVLDDNTVIFKTDNMGQNYAWAVQQMMGLLYQHTSDNIFRDIQINLDEDKIRIREHFNLVEKQNSISTKNPAVPKEWNYSKNGKLSPEMFAANSNEIVWWKCNYGHEWKAVIGSRNRGNGCPYCAGFKTIHGFNDFETLCIQNGKEELLSEWDYERNEISPSEISSRSDRQVWWKCHLGHIWQVPVKCRFRGDGCPYCSNHKVLVGYNDLKTTNPVLAEEWDYEKNTGLKNKVGVDVSSPEKVTQSSSQKVWWRCKKCGLSWQAVIYSRSVKMNCGCPYCAGRSFIAGVNDFKTWCDKNERKVFLKEWDAEKNTLIPSDISTHSTKKIWWKCEKRHAWQTTVVQRINGANCPQCSHFIGGSKRRKPVINLDTGEIYGGVLEAQKRTGIYNIYSVCKGKKQKAGGYRWAYFQDDKLE
ncbi:MAG: zinc-ribbon domain-containing protein [Clostridiales bacterium]|nr:zinc-ribbon domain-containing protein [Clostridiales bacterium]